MDYLGKGVLVTGGAHGIGKQIALDFLKQGAFVCIIDINKIEGKALEKESERLFFFCGDVANRQDLEDFIIFARNKMKKISILINNACVSYKGILSNCSYEDFDRTLAIGLKAPYELSRLVKVDVIKNKGTIINIASSRAFQSEPDSESYASAKGGIVALTHALSASLGHDVRVNCIAPGWINVDKTAAFSSEDIHSLPVGRVGNVEDIANMVLFLCSDKAGFITGETFVVDGGMSKRMIYHGDWNWEYKG